MLFIFNKLYYIELTLFYPTFSQILSFFRNYFRVAKIADATDNLCQLNFFFY